MLIPNWNGRDLLADYLPFAIRAAEGYRDQFHADVEIVVVDDASTDGSVDWLREHFADNRMVRIIQLESNLGFLGAVNKGFESVSNPVVLLVNSDVMVEADCIAPLVSYFDSNEVFAVCCHANRIGTNRLDGGGKIGMFGRGFWRVFLNYDVLPGQTDDLISFYGSGGYTAYDREKWNRLGGFQQCLSPNYWEDVEISYRAWKRGWKILYQPESVVSHQGSASIEKSASRKELDVVSERNRLLMTWINLHDPRMFASHVGWVVIKLLSSALTLQWNFIRSFIRAIEMLGSVRGARNIEKNAGRIGDRELAEYFHDLQLRPEIHVLADHDDELAFQRKKMGIAKSDGNVG